MIEGALSDVPQAREPLHVQYHDLACKFYEEEALPTEVAETTDSTKKHGWASSWFDWRAELAPSQSGETAPEEGGAA